MNTNKFLSLLIPVLLSSPCFSQGLPGVDSGPSPRGGTSAGGPLITGKTDDERWKFLQLHERGFLGKSSKEIISLFGKKGGPGLKADEMIYQITDWKRKDGKPVGAVTEVTFGFVNDKVESYSVSLLHWGAD